MTDNRNLGVQLTADATKETWSRASKRWCKKVRSNVRSRREQVRSPSHSSDHHRKDCQTPRRLSRLRYNGCNSGDSPSEADVQHEIIWDPVSPPPLRTGKGAGEGIGGVEISDIVTRIAPTDEKPVDKDLVLQWIGDIAIPCTPELQQPLFRRSSARRQNNNVEDLMKLAKQFDINMTRQYKDKDLEVRQASEAKSSEDPDKLDKAISRHSELRGKRPSTGAQTPVPVKHKGLSHEEELHALFDGPTQHLSGRLSPPSAHCSQESHGATRSEAVDGTSVSRHPSDVPKPDFDDDWENDDLLDDSFVLEVTQNPELLASAAERKEVWAGSASSGKSEPTATSCWTRPCSRSGGATYATTFSTALRPDPNTLIPEPKASVKTGAVRQPPKPSQDQAETAVTEVAQRREHTSPRSRKQTVLTVNTGEKTTENSGSPGGKDSDALWGDGDDDDLLYQACDDVERISASQEEQDHSTDLVSIKSTISSSKTPLSIDTSYFTSVCPEGSTAHPSQAGEHKQPARILGRSHSVPGASGPGVLGLKPDLVAATRENSSGDLGRSRLAPVKQASRVPLGAQRTTGSWGMARSHGSSSENSTSHHSTFKRHQSDPVALSSKVLVTVQPAVRCSAAEIEKKKQEAIARRRSRLQATEKPGAAT
ncbi:uncharacterized protein etaa1b [Brachyhypopomus gauderio]|uniref:uncharacterized protein etaa1b n=1 Tax=Brachyhypopomus gauderio TaxID=698409 RepID=UPI004042612B